MGFYGDRVLPRALDLAMRGSGYAQVRSRIMTGLDGEVLEIGFGSGLNLLHYPAGVQRIIAVDPATGARSLAMRRAAASTVPVEFRGRDAQALPAADESVDHVVSTWTLCTIPDPGRALEEVYRVLRPGGTLRFVEHGLAPDPKVARSQHRLTPLHRRLVGGCHLDRPISELITGSGLELSHLDTYYLAWPPAFSYTFEGAAAKRVAA
jgi:ubiquinone/menaquinone biosynthesis C-methylase UbiE